MTTPERLPFTFDVVFWKPWVETVDELGADPEQTALLAEVVSSPRGRNYYALLAHDAPALRERTSLFNTIMHDELGVPRADRELAAVAASRVNGCIYCASVHARRFAQFTKERATVQRLLDEGVETPLEARNRAIVDFAAALTRDPAALSAADLAPLRAVGLSDAEILDIVNATAMFAWANRLLQTLGESVMPEANAE